MAENLAFHIKYEAVSEEFVEFRLDFDHEMLRQTLDNPTRVAKQLRFVLVERVRSELETGKFDDRAPRLTLNVVVWSGAEELALIDMIQTVARVGDDEFDKMGVYPFISASIDRKYEADAVRFSEPGAEHERHTSAAIDIFRKAAKEAKARFGRELSDSELADLLIADAIEDDDFPSEAAAVAVGYWIGERLIARLELTWQMLDDQWGQELVVAGNSASNSFRLAPYSAVRKRIAAREVFSVTGLEQRFFEVALDAGISRK